MPVFDIYPSFGGVRFIESIHMIERIEDWSACRSVARAKRRRAAGHKTRMVVREVPRKEAFTYDNGRTFVVHPETMRAIRAASVKVAQKIVNRLDHKCLDNFTHNYGILNPDTTF